MTVTLDLPVDVEQAYLDEASARGITLEVLVREVLLAHEPPPTVSEMTPEEWVREFKAWTRSHSEDDLPVLPDQAISREFIYEDRGL